eukprot:TRINITY_DN69706_c0_g1_i1.p1 TRINITY_DN69706_c0_g1~~TRINITY_DN69706_c0_g1_i1.p1  ORF type:complete len:201 (-),score=62.10 TRINITY_DN69706_c0_g1_i1:193-795(-)
MAEAAQPGVQPEGNRSERLEELRRQLKGVGVECPPPGERASLAAWQGCLQSLCHTYLRRHGAADDADVAAPGAASSAPVALPNVPPELSLAALRMKVESLQRQNFDVRCALHSVSKRQERLQQEAKEGGVPAASLEDLVEQLQTLRRQCGDVTDMLSRGRGAKRRKLESADYGERDVDDEDFDVLSFHDTLQAARSQLLD